MKKFFILFLTALLFSCQSENETISIQFTGDVILDRGVDDELSIHGDTLLFQYLNKFQTTDFFVINHEGTFTDLDLHQTDQFNFKSVSDRAYWLKKSGVTHASVANNHSFDFGQNGFEETVNTFLENEINPLGNSCEVELIYHDGEERYAILSASLTTYRENFCLNTDEKIVAKIQEFKEKYPQLPLIMYLHWGFELQTYPSEKQKKLAKVFVENGADVIIGHHPHVVQGIEFIKNVPVIYSVGNFIADAYTNATQKGLVVNIQLKDSIQAVALEPISLKTYFPQKIDYHKQYYPLSDLLNYSKNACIFYTHGQWEIKPLDQVNFQEEATKWLFSADEYVVRIDKMKSNFYKMFAYKHGNFLKPIIIKGELSEISMADIDNDGYQDIIVGIAKEVKFDPQVKKRINIFTLEEDHLKALWLGTKFIHDIYSFNILETPSRNYLLTTEFDSSGKTYERRYLWDEFGFALEQN